MNRTHTLALVLIVALLSSSCLINTQPGEGEKIGQVVKFSKVGMISSTWEAQLIRGGMSDGSGTLGVAPFDFTVESDSLVKQVHDALAQQTEVVIRYRTEFLCASVRTEHACHFLVSITPKQ